MTLAHAAKKKTGGGGSGPSQARPSRPSATATALAQTRAPGRSATGLARVTAYWSGEGDYYTRHHISSTGIHLHQGHCAVDPQHHSLRQRGDDRRARQLSGGRHRHGRRLAPRRPRKRPQSRPAQRPRDRSLLREPPGWREVRRQRPQVRLHHLVPAGAHGRERPPKSNSGSLVASGDEPPRSKAL